MKILHLIRLLVIIFMTLFLFFCEDLKYSLLHQKRQEYLKILTTAQKIESNFMAGGSYPLISTKEFIDYYLFDPMFTIKYRDVSYTSNGKEFEVKLISGHKFAYENYAVIVINQKGIYWKDGVAKENDKINNINWKEIIKEEHLVAKRRYDKSVDAVIYDDNEFPYDGHY